MAGGAVGLPRDNTMIDSEIGALRYCDTPLKCARLQAQGRARGRAQRRHGGGRLRALRGLRRGQRLRAAAVRRWRRRRRWQRHLRRAGGCLLVSQHRRSQTRATP